MTRKTIRVAALSPILFALAFGAYAQDSNHEGHDMATMQGDSSAAYAEAMTQMHEDMMIEPTGDADADFVLGMIPHHEGAVAMAQIVLEHGKDPEIRALAEEVIAAQEAEIAMMKQWLVDNGHATE
ncbi:CopM family metallochaperone [Paracoccus tegillarcae]|uniref:DUF305 domain-containing protein n=1 Tax=Paracoccus tegillarcae TaxID=1529068 RepID=A0A2K9EGR7_9RHOB|nr:DUF305 domain-containing protein [Paracoccus tegillarcae]AUH33539.1 DUF305 domain-containing protein [Paracoccus tegillarcae]